MTLQTTRRRIAIIALAWAAAFTRGTARGQAPQANAQPGQAGAGAGGAAPWVPGAAVPPQQVPFIGPDGQTWRRILDNQQRVIDMTDGNGLPVPFDPQGNPILGPAPGAPAGGVGALRRAPGAPGNPPPPAQLPQPAAPGQAMPPFLQPLFPWLNPGNGAVPLPVVPGGPVPGAPAGPGNAAPAGGGRPNPIFT